MYSLLRTAWRWLWGAVALALVAAAVLLTLIRIALPFASEYRAELEQHLSSYLEVPLSIGRLDVEWHGLGPRLLVENLRITGPRAAPSARVERAYLDFDFALPSGTRELPLRIAGVVLEGLEAQVTLDERGRPAESGITIGGARRPASALARQLFGVERLRLQNARIRVELPGREPAVLREVEIRVRNEGGRHRIAGRAELPPGYGDALQVTVDLRGSPGKAGLPASGHAYLRGTALNLTAWPRSWRRAGSLEARGRGDAEVWAHWSEGRLQRLQAEPRLQDLALLESKSAGGERVAFDRLSGRFAWTRTASGWRIDGAEVEVRRGGRAWRTRGFSLARRAEDGANAEWGGHIGFVRVEDVLALARVAPWPEPLAARLERLFTSRDPHGGLRDLRFRVRGREDFALAATARDLGWSAGGALPGVTGLDGRLALTPDGGVIDLSTAGAMVRAPRLFRGPLPIADLRGRIELHRSADGLRLRCPRLRAANGDVAAVGRVDLQLPVDGRPHVDLQVDFAEGDVAAVPRYLPAGIMKPELVAWLDQALVAGRVTEGRLLWRGPVADFPHAAPGNVFEATMQVSDARLDYAPDWPGRLRGAAQVRFRGRSVSVRLEQGRLFDTQITSLQADIADFAEARLRVQARARGPLSDLLRTVDRSPLQRRLGAFVGGARAAGNADLALDLMVPLRRPGDTRVRGRLDLHGNRLAQPRFGLELTELDGAARFTDERLTISGLQARLAGEPVRIDARTRPAPGRAILIGLQGELGARDLMPGLSPALAARVAGRAPWHLQVQIPFAADADAGDPPILVRGTSGLVGTAVELPTPLGKAPESRVPLHFELPIGTDGDLGAGYLSYGGRLSAALTLTGQRGDLRMVGGRVRLGGGRVAAAADTAHENGLQLRGRLAELDLAAWAEVLRTLDANAGTRTGEPVLAGAKLRIGRAHYGGYALSDLHLQATREADGWQLQLDGDTLAGRARIPLPFGPAGQALRLRLDRLEWVALKPAGTGGGRVPNPARLPPMDVRIARLELETGILRNAVLQTAPLANGLAIRRIDLSDPDLSLEGNGRWLGGATAETALRLTLRSEDVGAALATLGYEDLIGQGDGRVSIHMQWPDSPWSPSPAELRGRVALRLRDGVLKPVDPGFARLFGLLDLKGLLQSGFQFDRIDGEIGLAAGRAATRNLAVEGSAGRLMIRGSSDLVARRHDHVVVFRPELSRSLPVIGVLSGGPATGVAVAVVQGLLSSLGADMETAAEVTYTLTGPWGDPTVNRVGTNPNGTGATPRSSAETGAERRALQ